MTVSVDPHHCARCWATFVDDVDALSHHKPGKPSNVLPEQRLRLRRFVVGEREKLRKESVRRAEPDASI